MIPPKVLVAVDHDDARRYVERLPADAEVRSARVLILPSRYVEGLRVSGVYATPSAKRHDDWPRVHRRLRNSYLLSRRDAPRVV